MSNYGSTRKPSLKRGDRVLCVLSKFLPERVSKRTGEKKPAENRTQVLSGTVLVDRGDSLYVKVRYPSGYTRDTSFFPHEVSLEAEFDKGMTAV
jgi:hypothetical protein